MEQKKQYDTLLMEVVALTEDIVVTSPTWNDFDDDNFEWDVFD